ncbi:MAG TPA: HAD-IIB family hydrolase [Gemmataceae bacterium]|nr:HAD-IIB family hydrolase [Gemmataceae bacterium]
MRYLALCCDYDGTLAHDGRVDTATFAGLEKLLASGRRLVLVTGRELPDMQAIFPRLDLFERVVAENGALLYRPSTREEKPLAPPPPGKFIDLLRRRGVAPMAVGRVIVATWHPHEHAVLEAIHELGLELQVIFNKGAVMVLPAGVNKASGLAAALEEMGLSPHNAVGVGDAENDHAFLSLCECSAAVANALPTIKEAADLTTRADHGAGVVELIEELVANDLAGREPRLTRHHLLLGKRDDGSKVLVPPYGTNLLLVGTSGSGKSTLATGLMERLVENKYSFCVLDPEGDYETFPGVVALGTPQRAPGVEEVIQLLSKPGLDAVINLVGLPIADRPTFFLALLPRLQELRARTGRPHWLVIDETHHLQPAAWEPGLPALPQNLQSVLRITVHPNLINPATLATVETVIAVGQTPCTMFGEFAAALGQAAPPCPAGPLDPGQALVWKRSSGEAPFRLHVTPGKTERRRHSRKYAEGELPPERSFYFRGPKGKLNLRAQNLILFLQLADGVDDGTWTHHLRRGDYSRWFREMIKDEDLAAEAERVEKMSGVSPGESRRLIREAVEENYTAPAPPPLPMPGTDARPRGG